jgi:hypothetical protein
MLFHNLVLSQKLEEKMESNKKQQIKNTGQSTPRKNTKKKTGCGCGKKKRK